jgi:hypothetical protein
MASSDLGLRITAENMAKAVLKEVTGDLDGLGRAATRFGDKATDLGNKMTLGITAPLSVLGGLSVDAASDMAESASKMRAVFGPAADSVAAFADTSAKNLGMSKQQALEAAGTYGNLFTAMGMGQQPAADMSTSIIKLAADLGSFNNIKPEEALEKLRSGLVGEAEPLRALGINLNADAVAAKAMAMGLATSSKELTDADKLQARYALIVEQSANAHGDFARTSDGLANSTKIAKAQATDLQAEMGEKLLPVMLRLTDAASGLLDKFSGLSPEMQTAVIVGAGLLAVIGPLTTVVGTGATVFGALTKATWLQHVAQLALNLAMSMNPIGLVVLALAALAAGLVYAWQNSEEFRTVVTGVFESVKTTVINAINSMIGMVNTFIGLLNGIRIDVPDWLGGGSIGFNVPTISTINNGEYNYRGRGNELEFAEGGVVPGPIGAPVAATVHGGERILRADQPMVTINANVANREDIEVLAYRVAQEIKRRGG